MAQGMHCGWFLDTAISPCRLKCPLQPTGIHWPLNGLMSGRKEPDRIAMSAPILTQHLQHRLGQRHIAIFPTLALAHVQQLATSVNVTDLQVQPFLQTQPTGVDCAQAYPVAPAPHPCQYLAHLITLSTTGSFFSCGGRNSANVAHSRCKVRS